MLQTIASLCRRTLFFAAGAAALTGLAFSGLSQAQDAASSRSGRPRALAPGVLKVIPPASEPGETASPPSPLIEITKGMPDLNADPHFMAKSDTIYAKAQSVILRRDVWGLEFAFKPLRMIYVDVPQPSGKLQRKPIWYMVYRIRNPGRHLKPEPQADKYGHTVYATGAVNFTRHYFPLFSLKSHEFDKEYLDRVIPTAIPLIQRREDPNTPLYSTVEISRIKIPVDGGPDDHGVWGVATWEDIDPRIDFFSIYVQGLTNAYRYEDDPNWQPGASPGQGRDYLWKTLQLNFWRPGDIVNPSEEEIRYGLPTVAAEERQQYLDIYGQETWVDHRWVYR
ncbi:MAG: hypothetical protein KY475_05245 [Planctomycetes bacterium]|nr:hypothetical protein [Planctomycetota bacterium]